MQRIPYATRDTSILLLELSEAAKLCYFLYPVLLSSRSFACFTSQQLQVYNRYQSLYTAQTVKIKTKITLLLKSNFILQKFT